MSLEHSPAKLAYSIQEAMEATSLGRSFLYAQIAGGKFKTFKVGNRTLIRANELRSWLDSWAKHSSEAA